MSNTTHNERLAAYLASRWDRPVEEILKLIEEYELNN
jgi:hypothetical protein